MELEGRASARGQHVHRPVVGAVRSEGRRRVVAVAQRLPGQGERVAVEGAERHPGPAGDIDAFGGISAFGIKVQKARPAGQEGHDAAFAPRVGAQVEPHARPVLLKIDFAVGVAKRGIVEVRPEAVAL